MDIQKLSQTYTVRRLEPGDVEQIYNLSRGNTIFYQFHPPFVTRESIREDMRALPPGKEPQDKFYIGFFQQETLVAMMDLIRGYPAEGVMFIGLFMTDPAVQGQGVGSEIIHTCCEYWTKLGYETVRLGVDKGNPQSSAFWKKNGFKQIDSETEQYEMMERVLKKE